MNDQIMEIVNEAIDSLVELKETVAEGHTFANDEREFLCRWVITHPDERSLHMWRAYQPKEDQ